MRVSRKHSANGGAPAAHCGLPESGRIVAGRKLLFRPGAVMMLFDIRVSWQIKAVTMKDPDRPVRGLESNRRGSEILQ